MSSIDNEAIFMWLAVTLERAYSEGHMMLVMYLESVLEEVLLELELSNDS